HVFRAGPVAEDGLLDRGCVARAPVGIHARVARGRGRTGGALLRGALRLAAGDPFQPALGLPGLAAGLLLLAPQFGQALLGEAPLLLGLLLLALALGQVDLLLAAALLLLALRGLARDGVAARRLLVHRRRLGHLDLGRGLRLHRGVLGDRLGDRLRLARRFGQRL